MTNYLPVAAIMVSAIAAILGVRAAAVQVRDNQDLFISDLQRQGRWASYAAIAAAIATALQAVQQFIAH
ncbi:MAG TPA: hypothetical protein VFA53_10255 [Xanthobacteraceae bacterium]|nr:hypothetical protein [Xanthobacteraceae bacterium]